MYRRLQLLRTSAWTAQGQGQQVVAGGSAASSEAPGLDIRRLTWQEFLCDGDPLFSPTFHHKKVTGMSPLSPYLNVDPRYLVQDTEEFILPTGASKTRGRFELAFFTIGGCCITGAGFGAVNGLRMGLQDTRAMAWSKPRNVQILNMVTRQGALWANTLGSLALLYSAFGVIIEKTRGAEDDLNTVGAGTLTGMLYKSTGGIRGVARGGLTGLTLTSLYAIYNNWDHMKSSISRQAL